MIIELVWNIFFLENGFDASKGRLGVLTGELCMIGDVGL